MSHKDAGHYAAKHGPEYEPQEKIVNAINQRIDEGRIACEDAHAMAAETAVQPEEVGRTLDYMEIKLHKCQLGLFGYGPGKRNIVTPSKSVPEALANRLQAGAEDGRISCLTLWNIAEEMGMSRREMTAACDGLGMKITACQLGAF
jgi:hypothetical protein